MATTWVSFRQVKTDVAIEQVLQRYAVRMRRIGGELRGPCPLPTHTSRRSRDSFSVSISRNVWSCRSQSCMQARGGDVGGNNILDLVALMEGCSVRDAALRLQDWSGTLSPRAHTLTENTTTAAPNAPLRFTLQYIDQRHPYLTGRGLAAKTIDTFGVGFYLACAIGRVSPDVAIRCVWPHLAALFVALLLITAIPWISIGFL